MNLLGKGNNSPIADFYTFFHMLNKISEKALTQC